jgi:NitT/TauT family transport system ATP-binding protein
MMTRIRARELCLSFGRTPILNRVEFSVAAGEIVAILGPSGSGKTSLLNLMAGLLVPTSGTLDLAVGPCNRGVSYLTQEDRLLPWRTAEMNARLPAEFVPGEQREEGRVRARTLLEALGLKEAMGLYPNALSGGMRRRVALARTLTVLQPLLLLDEPFTGLDYELGLRAEDLLMREILSSGCTSIVVTHDIESAVSMADRVIVLAGHPARIDEEVGCGLGRVHQSAVSARSDPRFAGLFLKLLRRIAPSDA